MRISDLPSFRLYLGNFGIQNVNSEIVASPNIDSCITAMNTISSQCSAGGTTLFNSAEPDVFLGDLEPNTGACDLPVGSLSSV